MSSSLNPLTRHRYRCRTHCASSLGVATVLEQALHLILRHPRLYGTHHLETPTYITSPLHHNNYYIVIKDCINTAPSLHHHHYITIITHIITHIITSPSLHHHHYTHHYTHHYITIITSPSLHTSLHTSLHHHHYTHTHTHTHTCTHLHMSSAANLVAIAEYLLLHCPS